jgi:CheY-like chemotaxis protein
MSISSPTTNRNQSRPSALSRHSKTVLFIDDERNALSGWSLFLQGAGYNVVSASEVEEGLQFFATKQVDAVALDYHMPEMNGNEAAALMKRKKREVVILMFSGDEAVSRGDHPSIDDFILKGSSRPFTALDALHRAPLRLIGCNCLLAPR